MEGVEEVIDPRQQVTILDGSWVKLAEVHTKEQATVFLPYHHYWGSPWAVRGADDIAALEPSPLCELWGSAGDRAGSRSHAPAAEYSRGHLPLD